MTGALVHERNYDSDRCDLSGAIEHFYDSFPEEWGLMEEDAIQQESYVDGHFESDVVMENGMKLKVEIFYVEEEKDEEWVCKAYKVS